MTRRPRCAASFHLPNGTNTDLTTVDVERFVASTPEMLLELLQAAEPNPDTGTPSPHVAPSLAGAASISNPLSYATDGYQTSNS